MIPAYAVLVSVPLALLSLVPPLPLPLLMVASALFSMSLVVSNTFWSTMEQQHVPNDVLGRVDSVSWAISLVIMPIAYVVTGPVADEIGIRPTLLGAAAIGFASTVSVLLSRSVRELRRLEDEPTPAPSRETFGSEGAVVSVRQQSSEVSP